MKIIFRLKKFPPNQREKKSIRKGHISTLHLWWARRPLVAARAAVLASLLAAPETYQKRTCLKKLMVDLCQWGAGQETINKAKKKILEAQRDRLNLPADTPLDEVPPPKSSGYVCWRWRDTFRGFAFGL